MKKTHTVRTFLAGVLAALLLVGMVPPALAAAGMNITIYPGISVYMDDQKLEPKDANGNPVMVFTYNGTTYCLSGPSARPWASRCSGTARPRACM